MAQLLKHLDTIMLYCSQTRLSPPGILILDHGGGLVAKRIEIISSTTPQMLRVFAENRPTAVTSGGLIRYISSGVWYGLRVACNRESLNKHFSLGFFLHTWRMSHLTNKGDQ